MNQKITEKANSIKLINYVDLVVMTSYDESSKAKVTTWFEIIQKQNKKKLNSELVKMRKSLKWFLIIYYKRWVIDLGMFQNLKEF